MVFTIIPIRPFLTTHCLTFSPHFLSLHCLSLLLRSSPLPSTVLLSYRRDNCLCSVTLLQRRTLPPRPRPDRHHLKSTGPPTPDPTTRPQSPSLPRTDTPEPRLQTLTGPDVYLDTQRYTLTSLSLCVRLLTDTELRSSLLLPVRPSLHPPRGPPSVVVAFTPGKLLFPQSTDHHISAVRPSPLRLLLVPSATTSPSTHTKVPTEPETHRTLVLVPRERKDQVGGTDRGEWDEKRDETTHGTERKSGTDPHREKKRREAVLVSVGEGRGTRGGVKQENEG